MAPTWRADAWTALEREPDLSIAEVAQRASCSFATGWQAAQGFPAYRPNRSMAQLRPASAELAARLFETL